MISKKGEPFDATLQFNADKRYVEFLFDRNNSNQKVNNNQQHEKVNAPQEIPKVFRGKELSNEQYQQLKEGRSVYLTGLVDRKGTEYEGFITLNREKGTTDFSFQDPDKFTKQVKQEGSKKSIKETVEIEKEKKQEIRQAQSKPRGRKM
ncbi:DUF3945 domain-containing protein [Elizabethkingia anophelis]